MSIAERDGERGAALAAVLLAMALLLPLGALAVLQTRTGLLTQQSLRHDTEALHAADAGLACALARLDPAADLERLPRGADGVAGTADDGIAPFALDCGLGSAVELELEAGGAETLVLVATGHGAHGASRILEQRVHRIAGGPIEIGGWRER